jgi:hypothetical protein
MKLTFKLYLLLNPSCSIKFSWVKKHLDPLNHAGWKSLFLDKAENFGGDKFWMFSKPALNKLQNGSSLCIRSLIKKTPFLHQFLRKTCLLATFIFVLYQRCWIRAFSGAVCLLLLMFAQTFLFSLGFSKKIGAKRELLLLMI